MLPPSARPPHPCYGTETRQKAGCPRHPAFLHLSGEIFANLRADFSASGGCSRICLRPEERVERAAQRTSATESSSATTARYPSSVKNALLYALARAASCRSSNCGASPLRFLRREATTAQMTAAMATPTAAPKSPVMLCIAKPSFPFKRNVSFAIHNVRYILLIVKYLRFRGVKKSTERCSFLRSVSGRGRFGALRPAAHLSGLLRSSQR